MAEEKKAGFIKRLWGWSVPSKRAGKYVADLKAKVHTMGKKEGEALTEPQKWLRRGYLQCQRDHAGIYKYKLEKEAAKAAAGKKK